MYLKDILSITGQAGLFKLVSRTKTGLIVENVETKNRIPAFSTAKVSALEDIAIYTYDEDMPLADVLRKMHEKLEGKPAISHKSSADDLKDFFLTMIPNYDKERVYVSDIKKVVNWYNLLSRLDMIKLEDEKSEEKENDNDAEIVDDKKSDK
ncbi:MAG: hypothetical protein DRJ01_08310 [Bacteroidetes bacterium]|nr:MAG: hypothetical protein DRJ01_08310 [Bacteroidota bacterium]